MERTEVLEVLKRLGWEPAPPGYPSLAHKRFGEQEAVAWYRNKRLSFEFYSEGRNVVGNACALVQSEEDVIQVVKYAEQKIEDSFYMRFVARKE